VCDSEREKGTHTHTDRKAVSRTTAWKSGKPFPPSGDAWPVSIIAAKRERGRDERESGVVMVVVNGRGAPAHLAGEHHRRRVAAQNGRERGGV